jgi:immunity protein, SdpI family
MNRSSKIADAVSLALLVATFGVTAAVYPSLPARIPTHFDLHGVPNGWMSRSVGAWLLPLVVLAVAALLRFGAAILPSAWRARLEQSPTSLIIALMTGFFGALQVLVLYAALAHPPSIGTGLGVLLGVFWIALGLLLPRVRRNPWIGVRTPWTLSSDENWARTHRFAGISFTLGGIVALLCTLASLGSLALATIVLSALLPVVQSYRFARHENEA